MRIIPVAGVLGFLILATGIAMASCIPVAMYYGEADIRALVVSVLVTLGAGSLLTLFIRRFQKEELRAREGFAIVTLSWIIIPLFGSLPFLLTGSASSLTDAYFESVSGFTTTGASIFTDVESLRKSILFWRALTHWMGGMGIIVLSLAILPLLGIGGMQLFRAEVTGPTKDKLTPRVAETARLLWGIYVLLTIIQTGFLMAGGMSFFDAVCHSFATISTGGFSTKNASIAAFDSPFVDAVVTFFMFVGGTSFALHYQAIRGRWEYFHDQEFRFFVITFLIAVAIVMAAVVPGEYQGDLAKGFRFAAFNVMTVMTCTGFATADFALWAPLAQVVLLFLMFPGACSGSTGGGMKNVRVLLLLKAGTIELKRLLHPSVVVPIQLNKKPVEQETMFTIAGFIILYLVTFSTATILLTAMGPDIVTAMSAVAASMANIGPGLGAVGPMANYAGLSDAAKWLLDACMILGRLELFTVFVLFSRTFWRT